MSTRTPGDSPLAWITFAVIFLLTLAISTASVVQAAATGQFWSTLAIVALAVLVTGGLSVMTLVQRIHYKRDLNRRR